MTFGIDFDDVLSSYVEHAIYLANTEKNFQVEKKDITKWGFEGNDAVEKVSPYYNDERIFQMQTVNPHVKWFMHELCKKGDVYIITAVKPEYMSVRAAQIKEAFPDFPEEHILMGSAKNLVKFDVTLDDGPHNILKSCAEYPVLFRQPWNQELSGVLSVNTYEEFLVLIDQIKSSLIEDKKIPKEPGVIALIGPSGSNKNNIAKCLENIGMGEKIDSTEFSFHDTLDSSWVTDTIYGGRRYALKEDDILNVLSEGKNAIVPVDMCGAMALKRKFRTTLIFCKRHREEMIDSILSRDISNSEKKLRLLSIEQELKHERLCDYSVRAEESEYAALKIKKYFR